MSDEKTLEMMFLDKCMSLFEEDKIEIGLFCVTNLKSREWDIVSNCWDEDLLLELIIHLMMMTEFPNLQKKIFAYLVSNMVERAHCAPSEKTKMN